MPLLLHACWNFECTHSLSDQQILLLVYHSLMRAPGTRRTDVRQHYDALCARAVLSPGIEIGQDGAHAL